MRDPFSLEAEHGVLGAMLLRNELIDVLSAELTPEDFYWPENGDLYRAILALHSDSQPADIVTVGEFLGDRYQVQTTDGVITGMAYIGQIIRNTPSVANAGTYSRIVRERAVDRALAAAGTDSTSWRSARPPRPTRSAPPRPWSWRSTRRLRRTRCAMPLTC